MFKSTFPFLLSIAFLLFGCASKKEATKTTPPEGVPVQVTDARGLDGCQFLLIGDGGLKLQPVNLADQYKKNGLKLYVTYKKHDGMGICMSGTMVELVSVTPAP